MSFRPEDESSEWFKSIDDQVSIINELLHSTAIASGLGDKELIKVTIQRIHDRSKYVLEEYF